jgi:FkbM family methyltransferase
MSNRRFLATSVQLLGRSLLFESTVDPWGEDDPILAQIMEHCFDEPRSLHFWCFLANTCTPKSLFLDVGAFTGLYALCAVKMGNDTKVVALEPAAASFGRLLRNICLNDLDGWILPANLAAGNRDGSVVMTHKYGIYTLCPGDSVLAGAGDHSEHVPLTRLDRMLEDELPPFLDTKALEVGSIKSIAAIKIDVEGVELDVLMGAARLIETFKPVILVEFSQAHDRYRSLETSSDALNAIIEFSRSIRYRSVLPEGERNVFLLPEDGADEIENGYRQWSIVHGSELSLSGKRLMDWRFDPLRGVPLITHYDGNQRCASSGDKADVEIASSVNSGGPIMQVAIPQSFRSIPARLKISEAAPSNKEMETANLIRRHFVKSGNPLPYMKDIVRAFRMLRGAKSYLEIGTFDRGNLAYVAGLLASDAILIGVDIATDEELDQRLRKQLKQGQSYVSIIGDSQNDQTVTSVKRVLGGRELHAVFIDGNHTAPAVINDYANYGGLVEEAGIIMLHDSLWEGNSIDKGTADAIAEIDKLEPIYSVPGEGHCHRFMRTPWRKETWGVVGVHLASERG